MPQTAPEMHHTVRSGAKLALLRFDDFGKKVFVRMEFMARLVKLQLFPHLVRQTASRSGILGIDFAESKAAQLPASPSCVIEQTQGGGK